MKTLFKSILPLFIIVTSLFSCDNNDDVVASPPPPPPIDAPYFTYAEGGGTTINVPNPSASLASSTIFARTGSDTEIEINLFSLVIGVYTINDTNHFTYYKPGTSIVWTGYTGTVTITENASGKLSGNFDINSGNGSPMINSVSGSFENITINP